MAHARALLRAAVAVRLGIAQVPLLGGRVLTGRQFPIADGADPAARVFTTEEAAELQVDGTVKRIVTLRIEVVAKGAEGLGDDVIDDICEQVEAALGLRITVGTQQVGLVYQGTEIDSGAAERVVNQATITYTAELYTAAAAPGTLLN